MYVYGDADGVKMPRIPVKAPESLAMLSWTLVAPSQVDAFGHGSAGRFDWQSELPVEK
jgi:hypothetical protein